MASSVDSSEDGGSSSSSNAVLPLLPRTNQRDASRKRNPARKQRKRTVYPMYAIAKERSIEFNLSLDINSLRQEVQSLIQLQELLAAKALMSRNSLMAMTRQFYAVFRRGYQPVGQQQKHELGKGYEDGGGGAINQAEFLAMMMDEYVDCDNGFVGRDVILDQFRQFSTCMTFLSLEMQSATVTESDDSVIIHTRGMFRARLRRKSLATIFSHVLAHEDLVRRLIGQEITCPCSTTFTFNSASKVYLYRVEIDFIVALSKILVDPADIAIVMGRARIAHSMLCIEEVDDDDGDGDDDFDDDFDEVKPEVVEERVKEENQLMSMVDSIGELPSLVAHGDDDFDEANVVSTDSILPIEVEEIFNFKE